VNSQVAIKTMGPKCISLLVHTGAVDIRRFCTVAKGDYRFHRVRLSFRPHGTPQLNRTDFNEILYWGLSLQPADKI